jgi:anhydro-N-acetylmuramic acid kinase
MPPLKKLLSKEDLNIIGIMSGTSLDGLDLAYCRISRRKRRHEVKILKKRYYRFGQKLKKELQKLVNEDKFAKAFIRQVENDLADFYAAKVNHFREKDSLRSVDLLGCHGQTIFHLDQRLLKSKRAGSLSWQIGESSRLAVKTGLPVISDFRAADIALGGSGAPLTPACHYHLFGHDSKDIAVLNIGGITNLTYLPKRGGKKKIRASDCGPGNMLVDQTARMLFKKEYDRGGKFALSGFISKKLLTALKRQAWFKKPYPKSLGREQFGSSKARKIVEIGKRYGISKADIMTTVSELTVISVVDYIESMALPDRLIVSGGGVHNKYFKTRLADLIPGCELISSEKAGIDPDYVEAVSFALLAALWIFGETANLSPVTGASRETVLGKLTLP